MNSKKYPRIHSLSTVGVRNHYNAHYPFHPFRTDFAGDSGVGKSIIADILQLIMVGEREFRSATDSSSERNPRDLVLERYGYVFLNIETDEQKYIVIGMYICATSIDPFVIQANIGLDQFEPFSEPLLPADFMQGDEIIDLAYLPEKMRERKHTYAVKLSLNKYHELLELNRILPIDLKTEGSLRTFAQIIRALSRGKRFKNNSGWLKEFFLNDGRDKKIMARFHDQLAEMAQELKDHKENNSTLKSVRIKYDKLKRLYELKEGRDLAEREYLKAKIASHAAKKTKAEEECWRLCQAIQALNYKIAHSYFYLFRAEAGKQQKQAVSLAGKLSDIEEARKAVIDYQVQKDVASQKYPDLEEKYILVKKGDDLLTTYPSYEQLRQVHARGLQQKAERERLNVFIADLRKQNLYDDWIRSFWAKGASEGGTFYRKRMEEITKEAQRLTTLKDFSDVTNTRSLACWTIENHPLLSHEQESVLFYLDTILIEKPAAIGKGTRYIPTPATFFEGLCIATAEGESGGFWVEWGGIRTFIPYLPERFFTTTSSKEIRNYFDEKYKDAAKLIRSLNEEKDKLEAMQKVASRHGEETLHLFVRKAEILAYSTDRRMEITAVQLEELLRAHFDREDILQVKSDLDKATALKARGEMRLEGIIEEIQQMFDDGRLSKDSSFEQVQAVIGELQQRVNRKLVCKQNRLSQFKRLFSDYLQEIENPGSTAMLDLPTTLSDELRRKRDHKKGVKKLRSVIEEETRLYHAALLDYQALPEQPLYTETETPDLDTIVCEEKEKLFTTANIAYQEAYDSIVIEFVSEKNRSRFKGSQDYLVLTREVVNEIPARQLASNEADALQQMLKLLERLNETHIDIGNRKLNLLKEIFEDVREVVSENVIAMSEIGGYLREGDKEISQGYKLSLTCPFSKIYPIDWIDLFLERLDAAIKKESIHQDLFATLREKIDIPEMMATAFEKCGGFKNAKLEELLNPRNYFDIKFEMESDDGEKNVGSSGQTYAVTALLCIARFILVEKNEKGKQQKGLRFMPIDEAEGIGSNFDLLERIASAKDYQLISMSIHPLDDFREGEQYLYILNGSRKRKERISTFAVFSDADEIQQL